MQTPHTIRVALLILGLLPALGGEGDGDDDDVGGLCSFQIGCGADVDAEFAAEAVRRLTRLVRSARADDHVPAGLCPATGEGCAKITCAADDSDGLFHDVCAPLCRSR